jgi:energy-coupling factor transporter ATP-binding protein EcfA2
VDAPKDSPIPGLDEVRDGPWPAPVRLECSWVGGRVTLVVKWSPWRAHVLYWGQLALEVATVPRNRQVVWSTVTQRILDVSDEGAMRAAATIPVSLGLFDREEAKRKKAYVQYQIELARKVGLTLLTPATATLFGVPSSFSGTLEPEAFERVVRAALVKLPFVTRGEESDLDGQPYVDIRRALAPRAPEPPPPIMEAVPVAEVEALEPPPDLAEQDSELFGALHAHCFGPFVDFHWEELGRINVLVGRNDTGKSTLLKAGYAIARSVQDTTRRRRSDRPTFGEVLAEKLMWTFQPGSGCLGELVKNRMSLGGVGALLCNELYSMIMEPTTKRSIDEPWDGGLQPNLRALFIPPKEILTSIDAITSLHEQEKRFGFDDTYYDLVVALRGGLRREPLPDRLTGVLDTLHALIGGEIVVVNGTFMFRRGDDLFWMSQVAEGIKKIGILARLLQNGELRRGTVLFLDEPETNLHPHAARILVRMLHDISLAGVQVFLATHSYFILKQLEIEARRHKTDVRVCSLTNREGNVTAAFHNLEEGMPPNELIDEALAMGDEDVDLDMAS